MNFGAPFVLVGFVVVVLGVVAALLFFSGAFESRFPDYDVDSVSIDLSLQNVINRGISFEDHEFVVCLHGEVRDNVVFVESYDEPPLFNATEDGVSFQGCEGKDVVGSVHNHNNGNCALSVDDGYVFGFNRWDVIGVVCDFDNFKFYTPGSVKQSVSVVVR